MDDLPIGELLDPLHEMDGPQGDLNQMARIRPTSVIIILGVLLASWYSLRGMIVTFKSLFSNFSILCQLMACSFTSIYHRPVQYTMDPPCTSHTPIVLAYLGLLLLVGLNFSEVPHINISLWSHDILMKITKRVAPPNASHI